jgi:hypothetical protein
MYIVFQWFLNTWRFSLGYPVLSILLSVFRKKLFLFTRILTFNWGKKITYGKWRMMPSGDKSQNCSGKGLPWVWQEVRYLGE